VIVSACFGLNGKSRSNLLIEKALSDQIAGNLIGVFSARIVQAGLGRGK
jgi:hypothetical protein